MITNKPMTRTRRMYSKGGVAGGKKKPKGMSKGGKLEMVEKDGKMVPFYAADGEGKMMAGGMVPKSKGYFKGGKVSKLMEEAEGLEGAHGLPTPTGTPIPYSPKPGGKRGGRGRGGRRGGRG